MPTDDQRDSKSKNQAEKKNPAQQSEILNWAIHLQCSSLENKAISSSVYDLMISL